MKLHTKWILITMLAVVILSPDSVLIRLADTDSWGLVFWRGVGFGVGVLLFLVATRPKSIRNDFYSIGNEGILLGFLFGLNSVTFGLALEFTSIANTLIIISSAPIITAIIAWLLLGERVNMATIIAMLVVFSGIYFVMSDSFGNINIKGDLFALSTATMMGISFTLIRKHKAISMVPAMSVGGFSSAALSLIFAPTIFLPIEALWYVVAMCFVCTVSFILITLAPRHVPAAEVGMIMPLETVLGPLFAWIIISEEPSNKAIIGGTIVILTLFIHSWYTATSEN